MTTLHRHFFVVAQPLRAAPRARRNLGTVTSESMYMRLRTRCARQGRCGLRVAGISSTSEGICKRDPSRW
jgi:hypothetical protein